VLKSGVALCRKCVDNCVSEEGDFVKCPISEYAYSVKNKNDVFANKTILPQHNDALLARCRSFDKEIEKIRQRLDYIQLYKQPNFTEEEAKMDLLQAEDEYSYPEDESDDDFSDFSSFDASQYSRLFTRLQALGAFLTMLREAESNRRTLGQKLGKNWSDPAWRPEPDTPEELLAASARANRAQRKAEREERYANKAARSGANQVVHNVHVLNKQIPKKWFKENPNTPKPADWEEKERAKLGWLSPEEQEELDEEEAEKLTQQRIAEWRSQRSPVPTLFGSVSRQRWAERLYRLPRQKHYIEQRKSEIPEDEHVAWDNLLERLTLKVKNTRSRIESRVNKASYKDAQMLKQFFLEAEQLGVAQVEKEIADKKAAEEEARRKAEEAAEKARKAEEKARLKAEAEARGEEWVDPDEGDEED
jgi:hypothetical protein